MRTVVLTGVSRGLGAALFDTLHRRGDRLVAIGRRFTEAQRVSGAVLLTADLADPAQVPTAAVLAPLLADASSAAIIHNAAVIEPIGPVGALDPDAVVAAVSVNFTSTILLSNSFVAALRSGVRETHLFISSGVARRVLDGWSVYAATKAGGEHFFDTLAVQRPHASVVNVNPGVMDTGMQEVIRGSDFPDHQVFVDRHANGELADPATIAERIIAQHLGLTGE
jgi:NAD(P)-dependent dehydrogenase (short-subunit alcohol dehydrogenase family)